MAGCNRCNKPSINCEDRVEAPCVFVEAEDLPQISEYSGEDCVTADELFLEIYEILEDQAAAINISGLDICLPYEEGVEKTIVNVLQVHEDNICDLKERIEFLENPCHILAMDISECNIDLSCLQTDACDNPITLTTVGALFQTLINEICILKTA